MFGTRAASVVANAETQFAATGFALNLDKRASVRVLNSVGTGLCDSEFDIFDLVDREIQAARHCGDGKPRKRDPFRLTPNPKIDDVDIVGIRQRLIHTSAFVAASSFSKMPKILTSPVMSNIFRICGFVHTRLTEPPCSRTRLRPPINTPSPVESIYRTFSRSMTKL